MSRETSTPGNNLHRSYYFWVVVSYGVVLLLTGQLLSCSRMPGQGATAEGDAVQPLWFDQRVAPVPVDTLRCTKVVALLIGIGQYSPANGWEALSSENDVRLLETTLHQRGIHPARIHRLLNEQATKTGIEQALQTLADTLTSGSQLIVLYAGHARQLPDDNSDEKDEYDEAIVPYDAPPANWLQTSGYLRDDDLNRYLTDIRKKVGPAGSLWLIFDSCHSATLNRGPAQRTRGGIAPMGLVSHQSRSGRLTQSVSSGWYEVPATVADQAPYVLFGATTDGGESYETVDAAGRSVGPLTRALCEAWSDQRTESYRKLFERMTVIMARYAPYQRPSLEGDTDRLATGCGSVVATNESGYRTVGEPVRVAWPRQDAALTQALAVLSFVKQTSTNPELRIVRRNRGYRLILAANNQPVAERAESREECTEWIQHYFARKVLLQLQQTNADFQVKAVMQRVAVHTGNGRVTVVDTLPNLITGVTPTFRALTSERVILSLTNTGRKSFYVTVVDLVPDGHLHVLLPEMGRPAGEYRLAPGQKLSRRIRITEPFGAEVYKLLLTPEPIDLQGILQTRGRAPVQHPYERIFGRIYAMRSTTGLAPVKLSENAGATADVVFWVGKL